MNRENQYEKKDIRFPKIEGSKAKNLYKFAL